MADPSFAAPGSLEIVRSLVNTRDLDLDVERLGTPADLQSWLHGAGLLDKSARTTPADVRRTVSFREALRAALIANHWRTPLPAETLAVLNDVVARADLQLTLTTESSWTTRPRAKGVNGALGALTVIVMEAMAADTWRRLKACANDTCQWAYYDHSRARSGKWCSMQICGNRAKQQTWRSRN